MGQSSAAVEGTILDPTTTEGFLEIARLEGRDTAHEARIAALRARAASAAGHGWSDTLTRAKVGAAMFDRAWEANNPLIAALRQLREQAPQL